jgi:hypothetical protein
VIPNTRTSSRKLIDAHRRHVPYRMQSPQRNFFLRGTVFYEISMQARYRITHGRHEHSILPTKENVLL